MGPDGGLYVPTVIGGSHLKPEVLWAYEMGYRVQRTSKIGIDVAAFYNDYSNLIVVGSMQRLVPGMPFGLATMPYTNALDGHTYGAEASATMAVTADLRITAAYSWLSAHLHGTVGIDLSQQQDNAPTHQVLVRASYDFVAHASLDMQVRYADAITGVPAYTTVDVQLSYRPIESFELAVVGRNLTESQHAEQSGAPLSIASEVPRSGYLKATWRWR